VIYCEPYPLPAGRACLYQDGGHDVILTDTFERSLVIWLGYKKSGKFGFKSSFVPMHKFNYFSGCSHLEVNSLYLGEWYALFCLYSGIPGVVALRTLCDRFLVFFTGLVSQSRCERRLFEIIDYCFYGV